MQNRFLNPPARTTALIKLLTAHRSGVTLDAVETEALRSYVKELEFEIEELSGASTPPKR